MAKRKRRAAKSNVDKTLEVNKAHAGVRGAS